MKIHDTSVYIDWRLTGPDQETIVGLMPLLLGQAQIVRGPADKLRYADEWMYEDMMTAYLAYLAWDDTQQDEPVMWVRHKPSSRRREYDENGQLIREYVRE